MFTLRFKTGNAAFDPAPGEEAARILRDIAERIENGSVGGPVMDANGNKIGEWNWKGR